MKCWTLRHLLSALCLLTAMEHPALSQSGASSEAQISSTDGVSDLSVDKVRQALTEHQAYISNHPNDPTGYIHFAYALSDAGMNDQAKKEVHKATLVAPKSAFAYSAQAWILRHNSIGVDFGRGFDYDAALASYQKAVKLYPGDLEIRESLANLLEHNRQGIRYAPDAHLAEAIDNYRYSKMHSPAPNPENEDNLLICLFYAGHHQEVISELSGLPSSPKRDGFLVAATAAVKGSASAITVAKHIDGDEQKKKDALNLAAEGLWNMRLYAQAADLLTASLPDSSDSKAIIGKIQIFSNLRPYKGADLASSDPRSPVQRLMVGVITDTLNEASLDECMSHHPFASDLEWRRDMAGTKCIAVMFRDLSRRTGLPQVVVQDIVLGTMKISIVPSQETGSRIAVEFAGMPPQNFFVLKEDGIYKVVAASDSLKEVGIEALFLLHQNQEAAARALLDWKREGMQNGNGDDPLAGSLFARLWRPGLSKEPEEMTLAAASLLSDTAMDLKLRSQIVAARDVAETDRQRDDLTLLLVLIDLYGQDSASARLTSQELLKIQPTSTTAVTLAGRAFELAKDWPAWKALLAARLQSRPNDRDLLLQVVTESEAEGDFPNAQKTLRAILDGGHALADDYNNYAWLSLFAGR